MINHAVSADPATDPVYDGLLAPGLDLNVAGTRTGQVVIEQGDGGTIVNEQGETLDTYTVRLAAAPDAGKPVYVNVSAARTTQEEEDGAPAGESILVSSDGSNFGRYLVLVFDDPTGTSRKPSRFRLRTMPASGERIYAVSTAPRARRGLQPRPDQEREGHGFRHDKPEVIVAGTATPTWSWKQRDDADYRFLYRGLGKAITSGTVTVTLDFDGAQIALSTADSRYTLPITRSGSTPRTGTTRSRSPSPRRAGMAWTNV